ncbi:MAG TPA: hypothetical protein PKC21_09515 [Oligoflexia bacterium]|nr:hypothetical protein [Oligoflexia bacterium]
MLLNCTLLLNGCFDIALNDQDPNDYLDPNLVTPTPPPTGGPTPTFEDDVLPAFASASCTSSGCHGNGAVQVAVSNPPGLNFQIGDGAPSGPNEDTAQYLYDYLLGNNGNTLYVNTNSPQNSYLLNYPQSTGSSHAGGPSAWGGTSSNNYQTVLAWIQAGAPF